MNFRINAIISILCLGVLMYGNIANAADVIIPGSACQATYGTQDQYFRRGSGRMVNIGSSTYNVSCPIPRIENSTYYNRLDVDLRAWNGDGSYFVCYLTERNFSGSTVMSDSDSDSNTGWSDIALTVYPSLDTSFEIECSVPQNTNIRQIHAVFGHE